MFESLNIVSPKQEVRVCYKYNSKNNIEVQNMINVKIYDIKCAIRLIRVQIII